MPAPLVERVQQDAELTSLVDSIAGSQVRLLLIADRVAAGRAESGDESRLRIQREITASYQKRLEKIALPTGVGDDAEAWLRSTTAPSSSGLTKRPSR